MSDPANTAALQGLLDRFNAGDPAAKAELIDRAHYRLTVLARKLLGGFPAARAEEETAGVLNESYFRLHRALDAVHPGTVREFFGLAALQVRRVLLDIVRGPRPDGPPDGPEPPARPAGGDLPIDLLEAIERLADDEREVVHLLFYHGLTQPEAGEVLGVHEDTVKRRWAKARVRLAGRLAAYLDAR